LNKDAFETNLLNRVLF